VADSEVCVQESRSSAAWDSATQKKLGEAPKGVESVVPDFHLSNVIKYVRSAFS
jgi:hypothetical protein